MFFRSLTYLGVPVLFLSFLTACGDGGPTPVLPTPPNPDGGAVQDGPPVGLYNCMHRYSIFNGSFYEHYAFHVDDLKILSGGQYQSNLSSQEGSYSYDAATQKISYSGIYLEEGYTGTYEAADVREDGKHHIENVAQVDGEDFTVGCLSE